jgi:hypothetical protein
VRCYTLSSPDVQLCTLFTGRADRTRGGSIGRLEGGRRVYKSRNAAMQAIQLTLQLAFQVASLFDLCRDIRRIWEDRFCGPVALAV